MPMPGKTAESVVEAYMLGILSRAGASMVCLLDNGSELKKQSNEHIFKAARHETHIFQPLKAPR